MTVIQTLPTSWKVSSENQGVRTSMNEIYLIMFLILHEIQVIKNNIAENVTILTMNWQ